MRRYGGIESRLNIVVLALAGGLWTCSGSSSNGSQGDADLTINELLAANGLTSKDESGSAAPWIELYNPTDHAVGLDGYSVTDDPTKPRKAVLSGHLVVPARGYLVLWCDSRTSVGPAHVGIDLSPTGGTVALAQPNGALIQQLSYGPQAVDLSASREPDGSGNWVVEWNVSPGAANPQGAGPAAPPSSSTETVPAAGDVSQQILGYDLMPAFELRIADANIAALRAQPSQWVQGTLVYQGREYGPVGVTLKGTRSFQTIDQKAAFKVNVAKYEKGARFFGLRELVLNNMTTDLAMLHERITYWLARQIGGLPGLRANHAQVTVNGQPYGLYANVEAASPEFLSYWFQDPNGPLFSIHYADFSAAFLTGFNLQYGPDDRVLIQRVTDALTLPSADQAMTQVSQSVNMDEFIRYWAFSIVVGQFSSKWPYAADGEQVGNDAGLYADPTSHLLQFVPEGTDDTFYSADFDFRKTNSVLTATCEKSPACFAKVVNEVWKVLGQVQQAGWVAEAARVAAQIAPAVAQDPRKPYSNTDVANYQQQMNYFMTGRQTTIGKFIPGPSP